MKHIGVKSVQQCPTESWTLDFLTDLQTVPPLRCSQNLVSLILLDSDLVRPVAVGSLTWHNIPNRQSITTLPSYCSQVYVTSSKWHETWRFTANSKHKCGQTKFSVECNWWTVATDADIVNHSHFELVCDKQRRVADSDRVDSRTVSKQCQPAVGVCHQYFFVCHLIASQHSIPCLTRRWLHTSSSSSSSSSASVSSFLSSALAKKKSASVDCTKKTNWAHSSAPRPRTNGF